MLKSLPFEGTIKVRNKGVDIALLADADTVELAFAASRKLVVCGVSTAVLEVTCLDPVDTQTLSYYEETTPCMLALKPEILQAVRPCLAKGYAIEMLERNTEGALIAAVRNALRTVRDWAPHRIAWE